MKEFQTWHLLKLDSPSIDRNLWIQGPLGIGKSVMAGYFIELLKKHFLKSIVAYFFCHSKLPGLERATDIVRTLTYQCMEDEGAKSVVEKLKQNNFQINNNLPVSFLF